MKATLVISSEIEQRLSYLCGLEVETAAVLIAMPVPDEEGDIRVIVREMLEVPDNDYDIREPLQLQIRSTGYVPALQRAEELGAVAIWFHTHPGEGSIPLISVHDRKVNGQLAGLFTLRTGSDYYAYVVCSLSGGQLAFSGALDDGNDLIPLTRLVVVGDRLAIRPAYDHPWQTLPAGFDRNVRAFGGGVQQVLGHLKIAVVGAGGTGSAVAEQLVRLGVRRLHIVDPDELSESNVTRVYGSTPDDVGHLKVEVLKQHLLRIAPDLEIRTTPGMVTTEAVARTLTQADVVFGCTDDNAGRLVLSRLAYYLLIPVIDCGVLLSSDANGALSGIDGRVTLLRPGAACLVCRGRIDTARANSELLTPEERVRLADEGYAPALGGVEPAVVTFTTSVAATAVTELLEMLIGYGPDPRPSEVLLRLHDREMSPNHQNPTPRHYCSAESGKLGAGLTSPLLEMTWAA
jgi:hypothetical protein